MALEVVLNGGKPKAVENDVLTVRLEIDLESADGSGENVFSYAQLIQEQEKKDKQTDPLLTEEDEKLAAIARSFEEKYGSKKNKTKRALHEQDLVDIGYGYDTNDSFVDDSEVYEDYVPPNVDTVYGGFYINTGELQFKQTNNDNNTDDSSMMMFYKKSKSKIKKHTPASTKTQLANKKIKLAKQQLANSTQRSNSYKKKLSTLTHKPATPKVLTFGFSEEEKDNSESKDAGNKTDAQTLCDETNNDVQTPRVLPTLPPDLPQDILQLITQLEQSIARDQKDGKLSNRARDSYDTTIADIKSACKPLNQRTGTTVLEYLACRLGITRQSLLSRLTRKLKRKDVTALEGPIQRLKETLEKVMPPLLEKYDEEVKQYGSLSAIKDDAMDTGDSGATNNDATTNDVFTEHHGNAEVLGQAELSKPKKPRPRKRFEWTQEIKDLVNEVMRIKVEMEMAGSKTRPPNGEAIILKFIDSRIKPLWPRGWVQRSMLYKMTESIHDPLTGAKSQPKKSSVKKLSTTLRKPVISYATSSTTTSLCSSAATPTATIVTATPTTTPSATTITSNLKPMLVTTKKSPPIATTVTGSLISTQNLQSVLKQPKISLAGGASKMSVGGMVKSKLLSPKPRPLSSKTGPPKTTAVSAAAIVTPRVISPSVSSKGVAGRGTTATFSDGKQTLKKSATVVNPRTITVSPDVYRALLKQVNLINTTSGEGSHYNISQLLSSAAMTAVPPSPIRSLPSTSSPTCPSPSPARPSPSYISPGLLQTAQQATPKQTTTPTLLRPSVVGSNVSPRKTQVLSEHSYTVSSSQAPMLASPRVTPTTTTTLFTTNLHTYK